MKRKSSGSIAESEAASTAESWLDRQGTDHNARNILLALPEEAQTEIMSWGDVNCSGVHNPSALLMGRIRVVHQAWVTLPEASDAKRTKQQTKVLGRKPSVCIHLRGECERSGSRKEHNTFPCLVQFEENIESCRRYLFQPILDWQI